MFTINPGKRLYFIGRYAPLTTEHGSPQVLKGLIHLDPPSGTTFRFTEDLSLVRTFPTRTKAMAYIKIFNLEWLEVEPMKLPKEYSNSPGSYPD